MLKTAYMSQKIQKISSLSGEMVLQNEENWEHQLIAFVGVLKINLFLLGVIMSVTISEVTQFCP